MSANQEFPEKYKMWECGEHYDHYDIMDWLKRCMEEFPQYPVIGRGDPWTHREYEVWFKKWFEQFKKRADDGYKTS